MTIIRIREFGGRGNGGDTTMGALQVDRKGHNAITVGTGPIQRIVRDRNFSDLIYQDLARVGIFTPVYMSGFTHLDMV